MTWDNRSDGTDHCAGCGIGVQGFYHPAPNEWLCANCFNDWAATARENEAEALDHYKYDFITEEAP